MTQVDDDVEVDPTKFGFPSFEEFRKNPDKWRENPEGVFATIEKGTTIYKDYIRSHKYEVYHYRCDTLEEAQSVTRSMGFKDSELTWKANMQDLGGQKCDLLVRIMSKEDARRREVW